ncbi:MAG: S4 domain-containing protein [Methylovirgula sp.]|uniref:RNA-binding S4 domain-containing protein n=1 Tax=Methylovirgula sp. TaxID=1978224 RepID=UPI0030767E2A
MATKITLLPVAEKQRLDKWLWIARVVKTRKQAVELIEAGYVRIDAQRIEVPAKLVGPGMVLTIALDRRVRILRITGLALRRGSADVAEQLFEDLAAKAAPAAI